MCDGGRGGHKNKDVLRLYDRNAKDVTLVSVVTMTTHSDQTLLKEQKSTHMGFIGTLISNTHPYMSKTQLLGQ